MGLDEDAQAELHELATQHRLRTARVVEGACGPEITIDGVRAINLASNDYLSLAGDPRLATAAMSSDVGFGAGASRLITGNHKLHVALERLLADWMRCDGVRLFNSGYAANVGVLTTLLGAGDVVFSDELNHASIIDGCRLSRAHVVVFPHRDVAALEVLLATHPGRRRIVVSETLFSMDGDLADVNALSSVCKRHNAALILDEAHAIGTIGPEGRGLAAVVGVVPDVLVGTCGKALGTFGAFAATSAALADLLWNRARSLVFSTAMPPMIAAATIAAIEITRGREGDDRRRDLASRARLFRARVPCSRGAAESAIVPIMVGDDRVVMEISARLLDQSVFVQGIRPPTVPPGSARLRVSVSARHSTATIEDASSKILDAMRHFT